MTTPPNTEAYLQARLKKFGFTYGAASGLAFALALWGLDAVRLYQAHALFPWLKLMLGSALTILTGGLAGWLTARFGKVLLSLPIWIIASGLFALYIVLVPLAIAPRVVSLLLPEIRPYLLYTPYDNLPVLVGVAFGWTVVAAIIIAVLQLPMLDQAIFSISGFGKIRPHIVCAVLMLISGSVADSLNNQPLRNPIIALDQTIQFTLDHRGQIIEPAMAREKHLAAFRDISEAITPQRSLVIGQYDRLLEHMQVLVRFDGQWAQCATFLSTPLSCELLQP